MTLQPMDRFQRQCRKLSRKILRGKTRFALINAGVLYIYFTNFQKIDEEEYGGPWELTKEGFMTSFALFLVVWIIFYSAIHFP